MRSNCDSFIDVYLIANLEVSPRYPTQSKPKMTKTAKAKARAAAAAAQTQSQSKPPGPKAQAVKTISGSPQIKSPANAPGASSSPKAKPVPSKKQAAPATGPSFKQLATTHALPTPQTQNKKVQEKPKHPLPPASPPVQRQQPVSTPIMRCRTL